MGLTFDATVRDAGGASASASLTVPVVAIPWIGGTVTAHGVGALLDSLAVNIHPTYTNTPYSPPNTTAGPPAAPPYSWQHIHDLVADLGFRHVRDGIPLAGMNARQTGCYKALSALGVDVCVIAGNAPITAPKSGSPLPAQPGINAVMAALEAWLPYLGAIEGPNEFNNNGDANWASDLLGYIHLLHDTVRADARFGHIPIVGPSYTWHSAFATMGDLSAHTDKPNLHAYGGGGPQDQAIAIDARDAAVTNPGAPIWVTEWHDHNDIKIASGNYGIPEAVSVVYDLNGLFANAAHGVERQFWYELIDLWPDPNYGSMTDHWGLYRNDLSPKPTVAALKNLISYLGADTGGPVVSQVPAAVTAVAGVAGTFLVGASGAVYIVLWQTGTFYAPATGTTTWPVTRQVTVHTPHATWEIFDPITGVRTPLAPGPGPRVVSVGAGPLIVKAA